MMFAKAYPAQRAPIMMINGVVPVRCSVMCTGSFNAPGAGNCRILVRSLPNPNAGSA